MENEVELPLTPKMKAIDDDEHWEPPLVKKDSWEDLVLSVETMETDGKENTYVFLLWRVVDKHGHRRRSKARLATAKIACPQAVSSLASFARLQIYANNCKLIQFFESHLYVNDEKVL